MRHIIIDGYNVIRADPRFLAFERVSLQHARDVLVRTLASTPRLANDQITVVFDGAGGARSHVHRQRVGRIDLLFSARGQSADEVIVEQVRTLSGQASVVVVSNDGAVREACRAEGCEISGSENLLDQIPGRPRRQFQGADSEVEPTLSTTKRGNPRRSSKRSRQQRDYRF